MRKTKIICTIGPSSKNEETLTQMCLAGMNVARLNFSHGTHEEHAKKIELIKRVRQKLGLPIAIMLDTKGPEYRIRTFASGKVTIPDGGAFTFTTDEVEGDDVEDFMLNRALHLFRRQGQEQHGVEIEVVPRSLEVGPCRRGHVKADFLDHLEEKIAEEIVFVFHEVSVDAVQEGVEFLLEIGRHIRDAASPALLGEDGVGDDRCLLIEEVSRNGQ